MGRNTASSISKHPIKVSIIGSRGIPANYGGFETFAEEISTRLAARGYEVFVSCEGGRKDHTGLYKGVHLFYFPIPPFIRVIYETFYDIYSLAWSSRNSDCVYILGYGAGFFFFIPKIFRKKLLVNVDGREWKREKYNGLEKALLKAGERSAMAFTDTAVADSTCIKKYFDATYGKGTTFIPYGATIPPEKPWDPSPVNRLLSDRGHPGALTAHDYCLAIARIEPDNNVHAIIEGFLRSGIDKKLVIVGDFSSKKYRRSVDEILKKYGPSDRIVFTGSVNDKCLLDMLRQNCYIYFHGHTVGGTNPSLLEAMAAKCVVLAHDNEYNREVGDGTLLYFKDAEDLASRIKVLGEDLAPYIDLKEKARERIKKYYSWETITEEYGHLFERILNKKT